MEGFQYTFIKVIAKPRRHDDFANEEKRLLPSWNQAVFRHLGMM
jgi:hypothetical protein